MKIIYKGLNRIGRLCGWISCFSLVFMMLLTTTDVLLRKLFNSPILGSFEITEITLMVSVFTGICAAQSMRRHVRVTIFLNKLPWRIRCAAYGLLDLLMTVVLAFFFYAAITQTIFRYKGHWSTDILSIPYVPFYAIATFAIIVTMLLVFGDSIQYFMAMTKKEKADEVFKWYV